MRSIAESAVRKALEGVTDPELQKSLIELGMVREVGIKQGQVDITLALTTLASPFKDQIVGDVQATVEGLEGVKGVIENMSYFHRGGLDENVEHEMERR